MGPFFGSTGNDAILISLLPALGLTIYVIVSHGLKNRRAAFFFLFTIFLTEFYIFATDPSLINSLYLQNGNYTYPLEIAGLSAALLIAAYYFGDKVSEHII